MNKYVVAFVNFSDNELHQEIVEANDEMGAVTMYALTNTEWEIDESITSLEELKDYFFNGDCLISVIEIDKQKGYTHGPARNPLSTVKLK